MLRAIIFDFDGLLVDTERVSFEAWEAIYAEHGQRLDPAEYGGCVGSTYAGFDPRHALRERAGLDLSADDLHVLWERRQEERVRALTANPGATEVIAGARSHDLKLAVGSSSEPDWLERLLPQIGLDTAFDIVVTRVPPLRAKPFPDIFLECLRRLGVEASEALVLEDSPHGVTAARAAGIEALAIPNTVTRHLEFPGNTPKLDSLYDVLPILEAKIKEP